MEDVFLMLMHRHSSKISNLKERIPTSEGNDHLDISITKMPLKCHKTSQGILVSLTSLSWKFLCRCHSELWGVPIGTLIWLLIESIIFFVELFIKVQLEEPENDPMVPAVYQRLRISLQRIRREFGIITPIADVWPVKGTSKEESQCFDEEETGESLTISTGPGQNLTV
ncbi:hypothetical protein E2I00_003958 [Balaenoptera physalus]|uniref:Uncharacterized protein n=1 Tax=Balaenoptera physalus TaxID=9770 RepID=A0A6A1Q3G5_BALPH|nr:hypothetical protein E2I00_003958 [Balaenoptera physalus]